MSLKSILLLLFFLSLKGLAQVIPSDRQVDWTEALQSYQFKNPSTEVNVIDFGAVGDGINNDWQSIQNAIDFFEGKLGAIYFPNGIYLIKQPLIIPDSIVLFGDGASQTSLVFNFENVSANCIIFKRNQENSFFLVDDGYTKGSMLLISDSAFLLHAGDVAQLRQKNGEWDDKPISWGDFAVGQIVKINHILGDSIYLEQALRFDYSPELNPQIRKVDPIVNSGIQCLKIKRIDQAETGGGANMLLSYCANCQIRGVESDTSAGSHIDIFNSLNILVDGNYIHHSFEYDGASKHGYGITLNNSSSACLITNNIFRHLRHAMMVKTGANGNVFSYNYSIEAVRSEWPNDLIGDISLHGHFAYANLFEGNIAQNVIIDHYWGPSGPYNTFFRNRLSLYGIIMTSGDSTTSDQQNFVGNETTDDSFFHGQYALTGSSHFEFGNSILGSVIPTGTIELNDSSYYLTSAPDFWNNEIVWPSIGIPNEPDSGSIPAKQRFIEDDQLALCPDSSASFVPQDYSADFEVLIWPNPARHQFNIQFSEKGEWNIKFFAPDGRVILETITEKNINFKLNENHQTGIHLLKIWNKEKVITRKIIVVK